MHGWCPRDMGEALTPIFQHEYNHGDYKDQKQSYKPSRSSVLVVGVRLKKNGPRLPQDVVVMVVHFHYVCAKGEKGKAAEQQQVLKEIIDLLKKYQVNVLIANMAMLLVVDAVRSSGLHIDVAAWLPWKTEEGRHGMDSMFTAFIEQLGEHCIERRGWADAWRIGHRMKNVNGTDVLDGSKYSGCGQLTTSYKLSLIHI